MEILCDYCGHPIRYHMHDGCYAPKTKYIHNTMDEMCECMLPTSTVEARYLAKRMMKERDRLKAILYDEGVELRKTRNHYIQACVQRDEIKRKLLKFEDAFSEKDDEDIDEIREQLRMCQLALRTRERAYVELEGYTRIAVNTLNKIEPNNPGHVNFLIAQDALDKIKGKF